VSWIDPNFDDIHDFDPDSNDDHPPSDVGAGQALVLELYEALVNSPAWEDTLLVVLYDEHGGFYDHVAPPAVDDGSGHRTLGLRVPALVVGPRVKRFVCHEVFDHTSLIKTILSRFAPDPAAAIAAMGPRVRAARDLGAVLDDAPRTDLPAPGALRAQVEARRQEARRLRAAAPGAVAPAPDGAGHRPEFTDLQTDLLHFSRAARALGLPSGQP
jgi:phospholipase C